MLGAAFGPMGVELAVKMKRLRLEYSIAIYHRSTPGGVAGAAYGGDEAAAGAPDAAAGLVPSSAR
jgi:hypothetical protein